MSDFFNNDISFSVGENEMEIAKLRLFGEKLLHIELSTTYGKKEIVCSNKEPIQNFVMLKGVKGEIERFVFFASYIYENENLVRICLDNNNGTKEIWIIDLSFNSFTASGDWLNGTLMLSVQEA